MIDRLIEETYKRHNVEHVYPVPGHCYSDCYAHEDGFHILVYHLSQEEKTAHEIACDDNGVFLDG